ncbi:DUF3667 domain-containing protein [Pontixanthobacter gangjinensis]|uniref:DUF3667 domain-containing protein n=1 Tax=Pontixanthobacter gangjinensis TaxID=1028742 RepID=A0A6I4SMP2_9SPHN|nr:DUF3667 domain-containing protein [Pontixanthobacter gangjinensis]MXO56022.1 DUF3667 domain-containing protein [Pontixanthobacter gangjinensis]
MSGDIGEISGAIGEAAQGAAIAHVAEPGTGSSSQDQSHTHEQACLNCGTPLMGAHCYACGQRAHVHRTLKGFLHDLVHGVLHFEGKFWRTMPLLIWRPGIVMREYIDGKRAKYLSPIALFLFTVFVSFAIFSVSGGFGNIEPEIDPATAEEIGARIERADDRLAKLGRDLVADDVTAEEAAVIRGKITEEQQQRDLLVAVLEQGKITERPGGPIKIGLGPDDRQIEAAQPAPEANTEGTAQDAGPADEAENWIEASWTKLKENPTLLLYKLQTNVYKLSWLLIPLSLPFMWILFPFSRRFKMYDHTVFVTYSISFMTMLAVIMSFGIALEIVPLVAIPALYAPFHLYRSLRGAYDLSRFGALWRMLVLSMFIWLSMALFALIMIGIVISG